MADPAADLVLDQVADLAVVDLEEVGPNLRAVRVPVVQAPEKLIVLMQIARVSKILVQ